MDHSATIKKRQLFSFMIISVYLIALNGLAIGDLHKFRHELTNILTHHSGQNYLKNWKTLANHTALNDGVNEWNP